MDARLICGQDVRRSGLWPTDAARAEAFVAQHGGVLSAYAVGNIAVTLEWQSDRGQTRSATAPSVAEAFDRLRGLITEPVSFIEE